MNYLQKKKLAFMSIVNSIKGFLLTVSKAPPLTLRNCVDTKSVISYSIRGNSVQSGTPTHENPVEVKSVGVYDEGTGKYKIPVVCSSKNLFNSDDWYNQLRKYATNTTYADAPWKGKDGERSYIAVSPATGTSNLKYKPIQFKEKTAYTLSFYGKIASQSNAIGIYYTDGTHDDIYVSGNSWKRYRKTSNPSKTISYIGTIWAYNQPLYYSDIQLEEGELTYYEPYRESVTTNILLDEPLRKVGDYYDYIDFETQKLVRRIYHEKITTVREMSSISGTYKIFLSTISKRPIYISAGGAQVWGAMSNKFKNAGDVLYTQLTGKSGVISTYLTSSWVYSVAYTFSDHEINTVAKAKTEIGDGFDVYYQLYTPIETDITLPVLPTIRGTTIYSIDTGANPSNMKVTYYSTSKE